MRAICMRSLRSWGRATTVVEEEGVSVDVRERVRIRLQVCHTGTYCVVSDCISVFVHLHFDIAVY